MSHIKDDHGAPIAYDDPNELINQVIATLSVPSDSEETYVSRQYNNSKNDQNEIQLYAKIAGKDWTYFVKTLNIGIGRNTDNSIIQQQQPTIITQQQQQDQQQIAIDLGPSKVVSRRHAEITYNLNTRKWMLKVLGRNGLKVDGVRAINPGPDNEPIPLDSGNIIDIGGTQMMFILPDCSPVISKNFLDNLKDKKLLKNNKNGTYDAIPNSNLKGFQIFNKSQINDGESHSSSPGSKIGEQDLSKDESKDIKPPFSYATMITQLILTNPEGILSLSEIYDWISSHYAYYRHSKTGWQNSIRHNLSLNKAFDKVPRKPNEPGKGMKWCIAPTYKNEFMKKWENGGIKARRGSSVTRQLQLHLLKNKKLPDDSISQQQQQQHQYHQNLKANPQLPQIKHIGSMPPPFPQQPLILLQQNNNNNQLQQQQQLYQNFPQLQYHPQLQPAVSLAHHHPTQQQQQVQIPQQNQHYSLPIHNSSIHNHNNTNLINNTQQQQIKLIPPSSISHDLSNPSSANTTTTNNNNNNNHDLLSTPNNNNRHHHINGNNNNPQGNGKLISNNNNNNSNNNNNNTNGGLSSPQAPLSAERGGVAVNRSRPLHHTNSNTTNVVVVGGGNNNNNNNNNNGGGGIGGFGDFVYSSPTKENIGVVGGNNNNNTNNNVNNNGGEVIDLNLNVGKLG